jgi:Tol biopolymer transport system component
MSRFDKLVALVIVGLIGTILLTVALGDNVGVTVKRVAPLGTDASSASRITMEFSEPMIRESAETRFRTEPALNGDFSWSGTTLIFQPSLPIPPGEQVRVILESGAAAESGREVLAEYQYDFTVRTPRIAYMSPANGLANIWIVDPSDPSSAEQVTFSPSGIYDFSVSPDGTQIAFSENNSNTGTQDIKLLDLTTGALEQITNCADAGCTNPVWRPDGNVIAYERVEYNTDLSGQGVGQSPTRVWTLDLTSRPVTTRPLFDELQVLGHTPQWDADGGRIAIYDPASGAILVRDFSDGSLLAVPTRAGNSGALSPDGTMLVYPEVVISDDASAHSYLRLANLVSNDQSYLSDPSLPVDDARALWSPDGERLAVARRDESVTRGYQIYLVDPLTGEAQPVTSDPRYSNMFFWWDVTGRYLVVHRFPELDENMQPNYTGLPEIWTLDTETLEMTQIAENAFLPRWIP